MSNAQLITKDIQLNGKYIKIIGDIYQTPSRTENCKTFVLTEGTINSNKVYFYVDVGVYKEGVEKHEIMESDLPKGNFNFTSKTDVIL